MKSRIPLAVGRRAAESISTSLRGYPQLFGRVQVAGSIRRSKSEVGDIEIVAEAGRDCRPEGVRTVLERLGVHRGDPNRAGARAPWGERYYRGVTEISPGAEIGVDLFVVLPPATWGVIYFIRTGSAEFSQAAVTRLHRWGLQSQGGTIRRRETGETLPCPDESTFFRYTRLPWISPEHRDVQDPVFGRAFARVWEPGEELRP